MYVYMYPASIYLKNDFFFRHPHTADDCIAARPHYDKIAEKTNKSISKYVVIAN